MSSREGCYAPGSDSLLLRVFIVSRGEERVEALTAVHLVGATKE